MTKSLGPVWHKKQKLQNIIPSGLRGIDKEATWSYSKTDNWVYGHGSYCETSHEIPVLLKFKWMTNSANESKVMSREIRRLSGKIKYVCMDSKADDVKLFKSLKIFSKITLLTAPRRGMNKTPERKEFIKKMNKKKYRKIYRKRSTTVEPMQSLVKDIFELDRCWMRGNDSNRWIFAAMGVSIQMAQIAAWREKRSTWKIKNEVLGL